MRLTYLLTNKHDVGATGVYWRCIPQRTSAEDCAGASFLLHHLHRCHEQALPCPRPPPTHLRSLALAAASPPPVRLPESKHSAVRRNSSFPFVLVGGVSAPESRESWLFKSWANSQTALAARAAGVFDSGLPISR